MQQKIFISKIAGSQMLLQVHILEIRRNAS